MAKKIKVNAYDDVRSSLTDAIAYERGETFDLRVTEIPAPPNPMKPKEIRQIRESLNASQEIFAHFLCVSPYALQICEQGTHYPHAATLNRTNIATNIPSDRVS